MDPLETYLRELHLVRGPGVPETSYYPALSALLNAVGATLKPKVHCIINPANVGAGLPDGGLYTADQLKTKSGADPLKGILPSRGVIEVKSTKDDAWVVAESDQVSKYWQTYNHVLVTNCRDFLMVGRDPQGQPVILETYRLADSEAAFWAAVKQPRATASKHADFIEYLRRILQHAAPVVSPKDVAWFLASYAREARFRIERQPTLSSLASVRTSLEDALGLTFQGERGEHFFRSTLVQTLFYGMFSAWVLWHKAKPTRTDRFDWNIAANHLRVPVLRKLFYQLAEPGGLDELDLTEVLNWAAAVLNRVERPAFFARFEEEQAVQYFYEPFLEAFDPELRKELGVWYTPPEIVKYQVARVDSALRTELDIPDGLADKRVYVLDPCCGTGTYLVEVLKTIANRLRDILGDALFAGEVRKAATERVFGFEILPAPFVVAHLQLGLVLQGLGVPLPSKARVGVYLTNALTGWEPPKAPKARLRFQEFEDERIAAEHVKHEEKILVILGNPPYNGFAGVSVDEERALSDAYRETSPPVPQPQGQGLNDLYVRFFRMAERRIVEMNQPAEGVVCFISNYSWLDGLSFTGMRQKYLNSFDRIWIDNLHGDRIISEYAPDGRTSETVFAVGGKSPGIKVGTAISLLLKGRSVQPRLLYRDMAHARADDRRAALLMNEVPYIPIEPVGEIGLPFKPSSVGAAYLSWPLLPDLFPVSFPGIQPCRDDLVVDIDKERLLERMRQYFDPKLSHEEMAKLCPASLKDTGTFDAERTREFLCKRGFLPEQVVRFCYRPFDLRWLYWEPETNLLDRKREEYVPHVREDNVWMAAAQRNRREFDPPLTLSRHSSRHVVERGANLFPLFLWETNSLLGEAPRQPNVSRGARGYLQDSGQEAEALFHHALAILHSSAYRSENGGALRQDWPRVPLPASRPALVASVALGQQVVALLDPETPVPGVTTGVIRPVLKPVGVVSKVGGGVLDASKGEFDVTAGWGHGGKGGVTMPGLGRVVQRQGPDGPTCDVYLNDVAYWSNIPLPVWEYTLGGYQVIKKWLSYREKSLLGRGLRSEELIEVTNMARRIAALLALQPALDDNYQRVKAAVYPWPPAGVGAQVQSV